ncbi:MAG: biosynthetic-type acetolactate synthase large subunit [Gammaproteobacteria bacterium AqS3]|nr:biosynthetic-type acetolactate synthase large subunit [Gammaproteobacteria bacterium AqS3]
MPQVSGGDALIRALKEVGVDSVWGYPGGAALHIYDALFKQNSIEHILVRHEQAAVHAADGYARATGRCGVVLVTSGPGATNTLTGIATAYMDSIPLVVISGQVRTQLIGTDCFQETDMVGCSRPVVKHSFLVKKAEDIPAAVRRAFYIATTGRPGPVVVDIPKDCTEPNQTFEYRMPEAHETEMRSYTPVKRAASDQIRRAVELLRQAERPVAYLGGGVVQGEAAEVATELCRRLHLPTTCTLMGLGGYPGSLEDPNWLGMLGMHGTYEANMAMHHSDVILGVGVRFDDRITNSPDKFCPGAQIIHIDIDPASIDKIIRPDLAIVGPADEVLGDMLKALDSGGESEEDVRERRLPWRERISGWRSAHGLNHHCVPEDETPGRISPQRVIQALYRLTGGSAYITSDVGQHQMFAAQYYPFARPRRWINSGGLGTMGFGFPAAMGVQYAFPDAEVICVTGEGSIQMCLQELATCIQYNLPVKIVNLNNAALGMVKQWQDMQYAGRHSHSTYSDSLPDFVKLVEAYGHVGARIEAPEDLEPELEKALGQRDRLVFVDIAVDPDEHVYPMQIAPGAVNDLWLSRTERS